MPVYREIWDGPGKHSILNGKPRITAKNWVTIHATANDASARDEASYAKRRADGVGAHYFCLLPETRILHRDLAWRPIGEVQVGDELVSIEDVPAIPAAGRKLLPATVSAVGRRMVECVEIVMEDGRTLSGSIDHPWLGKRVANPNGSRRSVRADRRTRRSWNWLRAAELQAGDKLYAPLAPWSEGTDWQAGYLSGIFDGEGCFSHDGSMSFAQRAGAVLDLACRTMKEFDFNFTVRKRRKNDVNIVSVSGLQSNLRLLGSLRPTRFNYDRAWLGRSPTSRLYPADLVISEIRPIGVQEVVSISTTSRTFFAEGVASHNCDNVEILQSNDTDHRVAHVGSSRGNNGGISYEFTGVNAWTRAQWLSNVAWDLAAAQMAVDCRHFGIPVVLLTIEQMRAGNIKGFITHDMARRAWGGTTHTDPGPNFPLDHLLALVRKHLNQTGEDDDMSVLTEYLKSEQEALRDAGFDPGPIDGIWGAKSKAARVASLKAGKGVAGPPGPAGPPGRDGAPGKTPTRVRLGAVDLDVIEAT